ncbi:hypothetical protein D3C77_655370 [compost metagenome]
MKIFSANMVIMKTNSPLISNLELPVCFALLSGVSLINHNARKAKIMEKMKIHFHPIYVAIAPPNNEHTPEPPQEPMDQ